jgi:hypothetical protein
MARSLSETSGRGHIAVSLHAGKAVISALSSTYPLKLLSPYIQDKTALVYLMSYGGGLVGGDEIVVDVKVQLGARLLLLSQVCFHCRDTIYHINLLSREQRRCSSLVSEDDSRLLSKILALSIRCLQPDRTFVFMSLKTACCCSSLSPLHASAMHVINNIKNFTCKSQHLPLSSIGLLLVACPWARNGHSRAITA